MHVPVTGRVVQFLVGPFFDVVRETRSLESCATETT